jgi:hypothetical protein
VTEPNADLVVDPVLLRECATGSLGYAGDGKGVIHFLRHRQDVLRGFGAEAEDNLKGGLGKTGGRENGRGV